MRIYRWGWTLAWLVVGAVPVAIGVLVAPIAVFCLGSLTATAAAVPDRWPPYAWLRGALLGGAATAAVASTGGVGLGLIVLAAATSPPVVARAVRLRRRRATGPVVDTELEVPSVLTADLLAGPVHSLDDDELCRGWVGSFVAIKLSRSCDERLELVNLRQAYLDELESRNAFGFRAWLRAGARPHDNPARYLDPGVNGRKETPT